MTSREHMLMELVDAAGVTIGACPVAEAHTAPGRRHRAFSVLLYDHSGRVLLQRRAPVKRTGAGCFPAICTKRSLPSLIPIRLGYQACWMPSELRRMKYDHRA